MQDSHEISKVIRFATFELNLKTGELRKGGVKVRLQEQSFQILAALLERPDKLVTREALHERLWPDETFVDFEKGLNIAVSKLRQALGDSADDPRFIETLPRRGYRFVGIIEQAAEAGEVPDSSAGMPVQASAAPSKRRLGLLAAVAGLLAITAAVWWGTRTEDPSETVPAATETASIVVLPFENLSGDPEQEFFGDGMSSEVIGNLSGVQSLRVISWTTARRYKNTEKSSPEIGAELDVTHLLEGSVLRAGDDVRITVHLTDARQDRQVWSESFEGPLADVLRLHREVAQAVAPEIEGRLTFAGRGPQSASEVSPAAYVAYLKGLEEYRKDLRRGSGYPSTLLSSRSRRGGAQFRRGPRGNSLDVSRSFLGGTDLGGGGAVSISRRDAEGTVFGPKTTDCLAGQG